ncbi:hypothetical protein GCM10010975_29490 [Comamonas phosphati]|nr:hypothetical protein GCM10010975_29490 [Comamonas phosphati]
MTVAVPSLSIMLHRTWWVLLLRGLVAIAFGVLTWLQPAASAAALVLVLVFGAYVFVDGLLGVYAAIRSRQQSRHWWVILLWGLTGVVVGVLTVVKPAITALVLTMYIGAWALITGVMQVVAAIRLRKEIEGEWVLVLGGVISVLFGCFVLAQPGAGMMAMLWVLAAYAVAFGVLMVILALKIRKGAPWLPA